jgi:hypothetical protein
VVDADEAAGELPVVLDQPIPYLENVHARPTRRALHSTCSSYAASLVGKSG